MRNALSSLYLLEPVDTRHGGLALLVCCLSTAMLDSASFNNYAAFVSIQTRNIIVLGLSTASLPTAQPHATVRTLTCLRSFMLGSYLPSLVARNHLRRRVAWPTVVVIRRQNDRELVCIPFPWTTETREPHHRKQA